MHFPSVCPLTQIQDHTSKVLILEERKKHPIRYNRSPLKTKNIFLSNKIQLAVHAPSSIGILYNVYDSE